MLIYEKLPGKDSYRKDGGARRKVWKESLTVTKILVGTWHEILFSPKNYNFETIHYLKSNIFWLNTLKGFAKAEYSMMYQTTFYPLKLRLSNLVLFQWESPTPRPGKAVKILLLIVNIRNVWKIKFH